MSWTLGEPSRSYVLAGRGHTRDKPPRIYRVLREDVVAERWSWHSSIALHGLFEYTLGYWEWAKDVLSCSAAKLSTAGMYEVVHASLYIYEYSDPLVKAFVECWSPSTNTLLLPYDKLSISLWDLYKLGGLPIDGHLMDEVVPFAEYLSSSVGVPYSLVEEVYCAIFLSCCLCVFFLPLDATGSIRPSVFKMASYMAAGKTVSPAIPVLASIYRGLHLITTARYPINSGSYFPVHYLLGWMGTYLHTCLALKKYPPSPHMERYGSVDRCFPFSLSEAYQYLDKRVPYWAPQVFTDDHLDFEEDMAFFLSLCTNMVGYREDVFFLLEAYNPHHFSKQLGFSPAIPGFRLGQSVTFPSASKSHGSCKGYSAWLDSVFSTESIRPGPLGPGKGKGAPRLLSSTVPSLLEDGSVDKDPKRTKWVTTRRPDPVVVSSPAVVAAITMDAEATVVLVVKQNTILRGGGGE
ncbi:hypothetical protein LIER_35180 [Lithospermum erythrorhizon]|uniref:Aminotransferase-like plant mobile domain-containing protein n=1 Tax=Lithospermum erythrorhizon TaxID=34254 RepID=A0AAV3NNE5_LITER